MSANTGSGIYKIKLFNREIRMLNSSTVDKKIVDIALTTMEILYAYLHEKLVFTISSTSPVSKKATNVSPPFPHTLNGQPR